MTSFIISICEVIFLFMWSNKLSYMTFKSVYSYTNFFQHSDALVKEQRVNDSTILLAVFMIHSLIQAANHLCPSEAFIYLKYVLYRCIDKMTLIRLDKICCKQRLFK